MTLIDKTKPYIICLNQGSGVLFQPADQNYSYILTAKHVLEDEKKLTGTDGTTIWYFSEQEGDFKELNPAFSLLSGENYFLHPENDTDVAILKVPRLPGEAGLNILSTFDEGAIEKFQLIGFPGKLRTAPMAIACMRPDPFEEVEFSNPDGTVGARLKTITTLEELEGQSGGGIFCIDEHHVGIIGIQNKIVAADKNEQLGRIVYSSIRLFSEIVAHSGDKLEPLLPPFLKSFSFLQNEVFRINGGIKSSTVVQKVCDALRAKTNEVISSDFTPCSIRDFLSNKLLLMHGQEETLLYSKNLWSVWLELLTILNIAKNNVLKKTDFDTTFNNIRLFYSDTTKDFWYEHLDDLAKSDYNGLNKDGLVVVACHSQAIDGQHLFDLNKIPPDISAPIKDKFDIAQLNCPPEIDRAAQFPFEMYRFSNISAFKDLPIVDGYKDFEHKDVVQIITKLKELYEQLIK